MYMRYKHLHNCVCKIKNRCVKSVVPLFISSTIHVHWFRECQVAIRKRPIRKRLTGGIIDRLHCHWTRCYPTLLSDVVSTVHTTQDGLYGTANIAGPYTSTLGVFYSKLVSPLCPSKQPHTATIEELVLHNYFRNHRK
jgi:hypothetical protein